MYYMLLFATLYLLTSPSKAIIKDYPFQIYSIKTWNLQHKELATMFLPSQCICLSLANLTWLPQPQAQTKECRMSMHLGASGLIIETNCTEYVPFKTLWYKWDVTFEYIWSPSLKVGFDKHWQPHCSPLFSFFQKKVGQCSIAPLKLVIFCSALPAHSHLRFWRKCCFR